MFPSPRPYVHAAAPSGRGAGRRAPPSDRRSASGAPLGLHGDGTRPAPAAVLARPPGSAFAAWRRRRGHGARRGGCRARRVQVTVPGPRVGSLPRHPSPYFPPWAPRGVLLAALRGEGEV